MKTLDNVSNTYKISEVFNKNKIEFVLLKGSYLTNFIYENRSLRPINDIDILVSSKDFNKAEDLLSKDLNFSQ